MGCPFIYSEAVERNVGWKKNYNTEDPNESSDYKVSTPIARCWYDVIRKWKKV